MMELKKILWECLIPSEFIKSLFQEELKMEYFVIKNNNIKEEKT